MAVNLLDMAKGYLTDAVISRVSNSFGESPESTQKALTGALPVVLSNLITRSNTPEGPGFLMGLLQPFTQSTSTSPQTTALADEDSPEGHIQRGTGLVDVLFGSGSNLVSGALAQYAGVKPASAPGLLGVAGALLISLLGRHLLSSGSGLTTNLVTSLLADQRDSVSAAIPSELASLPGLDGPPPGSLGGLTSGVGAGLPDATPSVDSTLVSRGTAGNVGAPGKAPSTPAYKDDIHDDRGVSKFWPWLLTLLVAALIYFVVRGCGNVPSNTGSGAADTTAAMLPDATATGDSVASTMKTMTDTATIALGDVADALASTASLGAFSPKKLPDGVELTIPANGIENKLIAFIEDSTKLVDRTTWFNFDRLLYETGSAKLKPESREQLQNIAAILKAYPPVTLKIGGYTDNTGNATANKKLSQSRAESAMNELVNLGVAANRLEAEGYGQQYPVAPNDTEAGRQQNRRTALRVTKK